MKHKKSALIILLSVVLIACKNETKSNPDKAENSVMTYDFDDVQQFEAFNRINLDASHPNMLNSSYAGANHQKAIESWTKLHQEIAEYLVDQDFEWEIEDNQISILHKIYFHPDGRMKSYFFRVFNVRVSEKTRAVYANHIQEFAKTHSIDFSKSSAFAQCGKSAYPN